MRVSQTAALFRHDVKNNMQGDVKKVAYRGVWLAVFSVGKTAIDFFRGNSRKSDNAGFAHSTLGEKNGNTNNPLSQNIVPMYGQTFASGDDAFEAAIRAANERGPNVEVLSRFEEGLWEKVGEESQPGEYASLHEATEFQGESGLDNGGQEQSMDLEERAILDKVEAAPPVPRKMGLEKFLLEPTIVEKFQTDAAHCRSDCLVVNVQIFEKALNASGDELTEKMNAMEATYLKSYSIILPLSYKHNSENTSRATALRKAHSVANETALLDVKDLEVEDGKRYADAWSQFTLNFDANGMPENYSLKLKKLASRPLPIVNNETEVTRF